MKNIVIVGAGGLGREVVWLIERINQRTDEPWNILGFYDDGVEKGTWVQGFQVLGKVEQLLEIKDEINVVCAIGNAAIKYKLINLLKTNASLKFPNLIDPSAVISDSGHMGIGNIICANVVISVNTKLYDFILVDWNSTVGHEACIESFVTLYPGVSVSGNTRIGMATELGTGSSIIQGKQIGVNVLIGAGAVVISDIEDNCTAVGCPAKVIKYRDALKESEDCDE